MEISDEFKGVLYQNTSGYFEKYFAGAQQELFDASTLQKNHTADAELQKFIKFRARSGLLRWLSQIRSQLDEGDATRFVSLDLVDSDENQALALVSKTAFLSETINTDAVLVLGLLQHGTISAADRALAIFCETVKSVFAQRPDRLFMHAFRIYDATLEMWTFDRAGGYCGRPLNIIEQPKMFQTLMNKYTRMSVADLGLNPLMCESANTIVLPRTGTASKHEPLSLSLDTTPLAAQETFVGAGTSCFKGHDMFERQFAIKFEWSESTAQGEQIILETAKAKNVKGVVRLEICQTLCSIKSLRQGLLFTEPYMLSEPLSVEKYDRDCANFQHSPAESLKDDPGSAFGDLTLNCMVTSPLGQPLDTFDTPRQLLTVLRDVVHSLQSLYLDGSILHRDISPQNIIIVRCGSGKSMTTTGVLIDLNIALDLSKPPEQQNLIGSDGFMAIGILSGDDHTYRHDLESVFYVFLWMAICHNGTSSKQIPDQSRLHGWMGTEWVNVLRNKLADMQPECFSRFIEKEFSEPFQPYLFLAHRLHALLFPALGHKKLSIDTDKTNSGTRKLYNAMIMAFTQGSEEED